MDNLVVVGGGGHAKVLICILKKLNRYRMLGYVDALDRGNVLGMEYLGTDDVLPGLCVKSRGLRCAIGIGTTGNDDLRHAVIERVRNCGGIWDPIVSPTAIINEDVSLGHGTVAFDAAVVNSGTRIGRWSIINTNSTVEHDCHIGDFVHVAPGVTMSGGTTVGDRSFIGVGSVILHGIRIAPGCIIGAGAVVVNDLTDPGTYVGVPARKKR